MEFRAGISIPRTFEELLDLLQQIRVKHQFHSQEPGEGLSGQVVIGRSQSTGNHHDIRFAGCQGQRTYYRVHFIGYTVHADYRQTDGPQSSGDIRGVRIDGPPVQQLVADAENAGFLDVFITHGNCVSHLYHGLDDTILVACDELKCLLNLVQLETMGHHEVRLDLP